MTNIKQRIKRKVWSRKRRVEKVKFYKGMNECIFKVRGKDEERKRVGRRSKLERESMGP